MTPLFTIGAIEHLIIIMIYSVCAPPWQPLSVARQDDWSKFVHTLQELKNNQAEQDEDNANIVSASPLR